MAQMRRRSNKEWKKIVVAQRQSGMSAKRYCEENAIGLASFYKWRSQFDMTIHDTSDELKNGFVEVGSIGEPSNSEPVTAWKACLEFGKLKLTLERS
jgi:putative transposase